MTERRFIRRATGYTDAYKAWLRSDRTGEQPHPWWSGLATDYEHDHWLAEGWAVIEGRDFSVLVRTEPVS
jgi:hypothetical protein